MAQLEDLRGVVESHPAIHDQLKGARSVDDMVKVLNEAGMKTTKAELIKAQARRVLELSDAQLEAASVSTSYTTDTIAGCATWVFGCCP